MLVGFKNLIKGNSDSENYKKCIFITKYTVISVATVFNQSKPRLLTNV